MTPALVIAAFVCVHLGSVWAGGAGLSPAWTLAGCLAPFAGVWAAAHAWVGAMVRRLDATSDPRWIGRAERVVAWSRVAALVWHAAAVLWLGEVEAWRAVVGDLVAVEELLAVAPPLAVILGGFWTLHPIERRVREAQVLAALDAGAPLRHLPSAWESVLAGARPQVLLVAVPLSMMLVWHEAVVWVWAVRGWGWVGVLMPAVQVAGVVGVLVVSPAVLRRVLGTSPMPEGPLRERLVGLGRAQGVRFREVLVWDTGKSQVNGAVMGLVPWVRYVLLTDALLERLGPAQLEAVMAHEVAHVRERHMAWMAAVVVGGVGLLGTPLGWGAMVLAARWGAWVEVAAAGLTLAGVLAALGFVSRRFEWQADAFAAKHLSGWRRGDRRTLVTPEGAAAMGGALRSVGLLNGIHPGKFGWRHGSIATRRARLAGIVGRPAGGLWIDREVRAIKAAAVVGLGVGLVLIGLDVVLMAMTG